MREVTKGHSAVPLGLIFAALSRPSIWWDALTCLFRFAPNGWWHSWPPVPAPARRYWQFRVETAYGGDGSCSPTTDDFIAFLRWCRARHP